MRILSWLLAGAGVALSAMALAIAMYYDLRDRREGSRRHRRVDKFQERPLLRLLSQSMDPLKSRTLNRSAVLHPASGPDVIVGQWSPAASAPAAVRPPDREAA